MVLSLSGAAASAARTREYLSFRKSNPEKLAELLASNCVKRGKRWLNQNAGLGWWRNCVNGASSRIRTAWSGEDAASYAFEYDPRFADEYGYVQSYLVFHHFGVGGLERMRLGFNVPLGDWRPFPKQYPDVVITNSVIDAAWSEFFTRPTGWMLAKHRHPTELDRRYAEMSFEFMEPTPLQRIWNRIRLAFGF